MKSYLKRQQNDAIAGGEIAIKALVDRLADKIEVLDAIGDGELALDAAGPCLSGIKRQHDLPKIVGDLLQAEIFQTGMKSIQRFHWLRSATSGEL